MSSSSDRKAKIQAAAPTKQGAANAIVVAGIVGVLALIAVVGGVIWASQRDKVAAGGAPAGTEMGKPFNPYPDVTLVKDAPTVDVYEDFRCPACKGYESAFGASVDELAESGKIKLQVHLKTVIDANFNQDNSALAASNALCAADQGAWTKYHQALFANQPAEPTEFTAAQFESFATQAGLSGDKLTAWKDCSSAEKYVSYVKSVDEQSAKDGFTGTPALVVNGTDVAWGSFATADQQPDVAAFTKALETGDIPADKVAKK